ncbi:MAG: dihydrodipicolinate synthase family protein [Betaproteobacteria bacterium]|nr:dihydrodipicolinate synthase family protein [Betaproteobacteria bacterium]
MGQTPQPATGARLTGVYPIVATPFRDDGSCDREDLARVVRFIVDAGADGVVFPGVASEFETLAPAERRELVGVVAQSCGGRVPLVVGVSAPDATTAAALAEQAGSLRAAAVMAMAPPALRDQPQAQLDYYRAIAAQGVPIILQNAPPPAGCGLAPESVAAICAAVPGIRYVKEETLPCGQRITRLMQLAPGLDGVFGGAGGRYITDELARGACGTMPACELVDLHVEQFRRHRAGDAAGVRELFNRMLPLLNFQAVFRMAMTKEVLRRRGVIRSTHVRAPGPALDDGDRRELDALLADVTDLIR